MQIGIVGLPFSGKSTLFQTITKTHLDPSLLTKAEAHHAIIKVPDSRLDTLTAIFSPRKTVFATIEFVDVVGLKKGESGSTQFTTHFLSNVKTNDALVQVVRVFTDESVPHPDGSVDPSRDIGNFEAEFIISDLSIIESRIERVTKQLQKSRDESLTKELTVLEKCRQSLDRSEPLRGVAFTREEMVVVKNYQLLSLKPMLIALNFDEAQRGASEGILAGFEGGKQEINTRVMSFFGKIELEMSELPEEEAGAFMAEYGIRQSALTTLIRQSYELLGLQSFFTVGEDECRAWTTRKGATAQEASGAIHSDFVNSFIRAEVVSYEDFMKDGGSFPKAKEAGHWRLEGKEYIVKDGDIMSIRHS